jgi:hypothetical protein
MTMTVLQIVTAVLFSMMTLVAEHYFPWRAILKRPLHQLEAYVSGLLAINLPLTVLLVIWSLWPVLISLWAITITGGLTVMGLYGIDNLVESRARMQLSERQVDALKPEVSHADD